MLERFWSVSYDLFETTLTHTGRSYDLFETTTYIVSFICHRNKNNNDLYIN